MAYICESDLKDCKDKVIGNGQCVAFVKVAAKAPPSSLWKKGDKVRDCPTLKTGTAIATFDKTGKYPNLPSGNHAAIYVSQNDKGILVYDQWKNRPVSSRVIRFKNGVGAASNDGDAFSVIE